MPSQANGVSYYEISLDSPGHGIAPVKRKKVRLTVHTIGGCHPERRVKATGAALSIEYMQGVHEAFLVYTGLSWAACYVAVLDFPVFLIH